MANKLLNRLIINEIKPFLATNDVIVLHGARQVGKTSILLLLEQSLKEKGETTFFIDLEDSRNLQVLDSGIDELIKHLTEEGVYPRPGKTYVFLDEIQYLADPSKLLKLAADHHPELKLIVSGSSSFLLKKKFSDSLVGRTVDFEVHNLSFAEFLLFKGLLSISPGKATVKKLEALKSLYEEYVLYGGYPKIVLTPDLLMKEKYLQQIIDTYIRKDIRDLAEIKDVNKFNRLLETLAAQSGQLLNVHELSNTCNLAKQTVENYLFLLEQTYILRLVRPFSTNLRTELSKTPKVFFFDTGIMQLLWLKTLPREILGQAFETSVFSELAKNYGVDKVFFWRTTDKKEIDFILKRANTPLPLEVKISFAQFHPGAIKAFLAKYQLQEYKIIALRGNAKAPNSLYPWQLDNLK